MTLLLSGSKNITIALTSHLSLLFAKSRLYLDPGG